MLVCYPPDGWACALRDAVIVLSVMSLTRSALLSGKVSPCQCRHAHGAADTRSACAGGAVRGASPAARPSPIAARKHA
jgi:hypothetical protein